MFRQNNNFLRRPACFLLIVFFGEGDFSDAFTPFDCFAVALFVFFFDMFFTCSDFKGLQPVRLLLSKEVA